MGINDQIKQGGKLMVMTFQRSSQVSFTLIYPDLGYWSIIWKVNTTNMRVNLKNTSAHMPLVVEISSKAFLLF